MIKGISVIVPAYNAATWLPKSIPLVDRALIKSGVPKAEIIIINDGSSDNTKEIISTINTIFPISIYSYKNGGRFLARKRGVAKAKYNHILFIDTRVYIAPKALKFIIQKSKSEPNREVWTSHVYLDKEGNIYARFWEAITYIAWRRYFSKPRDVSYGMKDFDLYPKGTTCFFVPKKYIKDANAWFENNTNDMTNSNDDTLLIRRIAEQTNININPEFNCTYHARTNLKQFIKHTHHRGKVFVDGFLRRDGNILFYPLVLFLFLSVAIPIILILYPSLAGIFFIIFIGTWILGFIAMVLLGVKFLDAASFFILSPLFLFVYGSGIWRAFIKIKIKPILSKVS